VNGERGFSTVDFAAALLAGVPCATAAPAAATIAIIANDDMRIDPNSIFTTLLNRCVPRMMAKGIENRNTMRRISPCRTRLDTRNFTVSYRPS
jgi:hypothetical protein